MFFANRNTPKNMHLLDKIHTVFTAALSESHVAVGKTAVVKTSCTILIFPVQLTTSRIGNLYPVDPYSCCM